MSWRRGPSATTRGSDGVTTGCQRRGGCAARHPALRCICDAARACARHAGMDRIRCSPMWAPSSPDKETTSMLRPLTLGGRPTATPTDRPVPDRAMDILQYGMALLALAGAIVLGSLR